MPIASWSLLRQIEALRVATGTALQFGAIAKGKRTVDDSEILDWLKSQGFECDENTPPFLLAAMSLDHLKQPWGSTIVQMGQRSAQDCNDIGRKRSGAEFKNQTDFVISSALVRLLGSYEQFERDVLKCLLYYRPKGKSCDPSEYEAEEITADVVAEAGIKDGDKFRYEKPTLWTWISRHAENNVERHRIFSNVYDIKCVPDKDARKQFARLYEMRNMVAHGREGVSVTLGEYRDAEYLLTSCMIHLITECNQRFRLAI